MLGFEDPVAEGFADRQSPGDEAPGEVLVALVGRDERPPDKRVSEVLVVPSRSRIAIASSA